MLTYQYLKSPNRTSSCWYHVKAMRRYGSSAFFLVLTIYPAFGIPDSITECFVHNVQFGEAGSETNSSGMKVFMGPGQAELRLTNSCEEEIYWKACIQRYIDVRYSDANEKGGTGFENVSGVLNLHESESLEYELPKGGLIAYTLALSRTEVRLPKEQMFCGWTDATCRDAMRESYTRKPKMQAKLLALAVAKKECEIGSKEACEDTMSLSADVRSQISELGGGANDSIGDAINNNIDKALVEKCGFLPNRTGYLEM